MRPITLFAVIDSAGEVVVDSVAPDSYSAMLRFISIDGMGKYANQGWDQAEADGYKMGQINVPLDGATCKPS